MTPAGATSTATPIEPLQLTPDECENSIRALQEMVRFETVSSTAVASGAYAACAQWIHDQLRAILGTAGTVRGRDDDPSSSSRVFFLPEAPASAPVVVAIIDGSSSTLPCLLLNAHYDVVPALVADWTVPPFEGVRQPAPPNQLPGPTRRTRTTADSATTNEAVTNNIYGRGTQDMKSVCIQYLLALQYLWQRDPHWRPVRTLYLTFVPDEEVGGHGMAAFLASETYQTLRATHGDIALALDEGLASTDDTFSVFYGERLPWWVNVTATGPTGHGSRFIPDTAVEQLLALTQKALAFRQGQRDLLGLTHETNCAHVVAAKRLKQHQSNDNGDTTTVETESLWSPNDRTPSLTSEKRKTLGDVTSLNITTLEAGVRVGNTFAYNCVPPSASCTLDIRIAPDVSPQDIGDMLNQWCHECSIDKSAPSTVDKAKSQVRWNYLGHGNDMQQHHTTSLDPVVNPWYGVFASSLSHLGYAVQPQVFPAATDSRFLRALGIRALGFSPMRKTEIMLHENDEYIPESTFLEGIAVYYSLIHALAAQGESVDGGTNA